MGRDVLKPVPQESVKLEQAPEATVARGSVVLGAAIAALRSGSSAGWEMAKVLAQAPAKLLPSPRSSRPVSGAQAYDDWEKKRDK